MPDINCPRCNVRIPGDMPVCPFCRQPVEPAADEVRQDIRKLLVPPERFQGLRKFYCEYGKWLKVAVPALIAIPVLWIVFLLMTRLTVEIPKDSVFLIEVEHEKKGGRTSLLKGTITNLGEDIPDLSLRSIGVTAEFRWSDGRVERKRVFPKSPFRGEGALFRGETGTFEIEVPNHADAVTLWAGIVNLGEGRPFGLPGEKGRRPGRKRK